jgi:hypothetical protein
MLLYTLFLRPRHKFYFYSFNRGLLDIGGGSKDDDIKHIFSVCVGGGGRGECTNKQSKRDVFTARSAVENISLLCPMCGTRYI